MKSADEAAHSAAHTKPSAISSSGDGEEEVECSKCHMYFGLRATIEAHERRHAQHADDDLHKFQNPGDYSVHSKAATAAEARFDHPRKQKGLERALKKENVELEPSSTAAAAAPSAAAAAAPSAAAATVPSASAASSASEADANRAGVGTPVTTDEGAAEAAPSSAVTAPNEEPAAIV